MDSLAREVFAETNKARSNPTSYIPYLQEMLGQFKGQVLYRQGEIPLRTNEGSSAVQECINYLSNLKSLRPLLWDDNMSRAAADHANDIGPKGISGHTGSDGSSMSTRLNRYGEWMGKIGENIDFGGKRGRDVVISLIVDDGVSNRGHRTNLFSPDFQKTGVACSSHQQYEVCTVLDYASEYTPTGGQRADNTPKFTNNYGSYNTTPSSSNQYGNNQFQQVPPSFSGFEIPPSFSSNQQPYGNTSYQQTPPSTQYPVNYDSLSKDAFQEQNRIRQNPQSYIPYLEEYLRNFNGMVLRKPGEIPLRTHEGPGAVQECINFLRNQQPLNALEWDSNIARACQDHANDIGPKGLCGHTGSDGSSMSSRLERYGDWNGKIGENCDFGSSTGRDIVISLIVDDGVSNRGHRNNLFSQDFTKVGVGCAPHSEYKTCSVFDYAAQYGPKGQSNTNNSFNAPTFQKSTTPFRGGFNQPQDNYSYPQQTSFTQPNQAYQSNVPSYGNSNFQEPYGFNSNTFTTTNPNDNSKTTTTSKTYSSNNFNDPFIQEQLKKYNIQGLGTNINPSGVNEDQDKPPNTIETLTQKNIQIVNGRKTITETKTYKLADGSQRITERTYYE